MTTNLPPGIQEICDTEDERPIRSWPFVRHQIQYVYGDSDSGTVLADFVADGPLPFPVKGQVIRLHGVLVKVLGVAVGYEAMEDGAPAVLAAVQVDDAGLFPADQEEE